MRAFAAVLTLSLCVAACDGANAARDPAHVDGPKPVVAARRGRSSPSESEPATSAKTSTENPSSRRGHVVGRILDDSGGVPPGAAIRLPRITGRRSGYDCICRTTPADAEGRFDWNDPRALGPEVRLVRLVADAEGFAPWVGPWIEAGAELVDVGTIRLRRGESIEGVVCDVEGAAVAHVELELTPDAETVSEDWQATIPRGLWMTLDRRAAEGARPLSTAKDGTFRFDGLAPGGYRLRCSRPGAPQPVVVATGTRDARIVLPPALCPRRVAVDVVAYDDAGRRLDAFRAWLLGEGVTEHADAQDGVAHADVTTWGPVTLHVERDDEDQLVDLGAVESRGEPYVATFPAFHEIRGTVSFDGGPLRWRRDAPDGGRSVPVWVSATPDPPGRDRRLRHTPPSATTEPDGTFVLRVPYAGRWSLHASDSCTKSPVAGEGAADAEATDAVVLLHRITDLDVFVLPPEGARLGQVYGWLRDPSSSAKPFFRVDYEVPGRLRFIEAIAGPPLVLIVRGTIDGERSLVSTTDVRADGGPFEVRLARGLAVDGVVVRRDGTPVVDCRVRCAPSSDADDADCERATTGLDGRFHVAGLASGTWFLTAGTGALECVAAVEATAGSRDVRLVAVPRRPPF
jgi:hypothetical protein